MRVSLFYSSVKVSGSDYLKDNSSVQDKKLSLDLKVSGILTRLKVEEKWM